MNEAKVEVMTTCCNRPSYSEQVFLLVKRDPPMDGHGKREIGFVSVCVGCLKPCGVTKRGPFCPKDFSSADWALMMRTHPKPPYIFEKRGERYLPETYTEPASKRGGQDMAAGE